MTDLGNRCTFVPPYLLRQLADRLPGAVAETLRVDAELRGRREESAAPASATPESAAPEPATPSAQAHGAWTVHTAANGTMLPGRVVRSEGDADSGDIAVDEAAAGIVATLALTDDLGRSSYDDLGSAVSLTVHYGRDYDNAFWDGTQLVFGDGDGQIFDRFTKALDVMAHEFGHAVTQYSAGLVYRDQPGALNESLSDVFAACVKQRVLGQQAVEADWLIGEGIFMPTVRARALRDMANPGTAYDDPALGKDPQVGHMDDYVGTDEDNGGVHLNSGIPNRAFHLAATAIGGTAWEGAGRIWWQAWTEGTLRPTTDFAAFADATIAAAGEHQDAVAQAWADVGVAADRPAPDSGAGGGAPAGAPGVVQVSRSGGFAGRTVEGEIDLDGDSPEAKQAAFLCRRVDLRTVRGGLPNPDQFVYCFRLPDQPEARVPEQHLTPELSELADLVLGTRSG